MGLFGKSEPETVMLGDLKLHCEICKGDRFWQREGQLNTSVASFFDLDWLNSSAVCFVCEGCGYIHWFLPKSKW
jgi:hypothetical protein